MNTTFKFALLASSFLFVAACEAPTDTSGAGGTGDANAYGDANGYGNGGESGLLAPGVGDRVFFATNSSSVDSEGQATLEKQANWLKSNGAVNVVLEGHADERGTREFNIALGERRANAAKNQLVSLGVPASRISVVSYGKERPAVMGSDESAWSQNRRAVTVIAR